MLFNCSCCHQFSHWAGCLQAYIETYDTGIALGVHSQAVRHKPHIAKCVGKQRYVITWLSCSVCESCKHALFGFRDRLVPVCMILAQSLWLTCPSINCCPCCCIGHTWLQAKGPSGLDTACSTSNSIQMALPALSSPYM